MDKIHNLSSLNQVTYLMIPFINLCGNVKYLFMHNVAYLQQ